VHFVVISSPGFMVEYYILKEVINVREKIEAALRKIRPMLQMDGGDVELIDVTNDGVVKVRLRGACMGCPMSQMTLKAGIEKQLMTDVPEIKEVIAVD